MHALEGCYKQGRTLKKLHILPPSMQCSGNHNKKWQTNHKNQPLKQDYFNRREFALYYKHTYLKKAFTHIPRD